MHSLLCIATALALVTGPGPIGDEEPVAPGTAATAAESTREATKEKEPAPEPTDDDIPDLGALDALPGMSGETPSSSPPSSEIPDLGSLDAIPGTAPPTEAKGRQPAPPTTAIPKREGERFGDIFTGSMRLTGAFLHFDDIPEVFPEGDDALLASVFRMIAKRDVSKRAGIELNYFLDFSRSPSGGAAAGAFATAGSAGSAYRNPLLQHRWWRDGSVSGSAGVDRFVFDIDAGPVDIAIGRFPISYTVTGLFTPNDFFSPFSASAVNRIYKPGVDAIRVGGAIGMNSAVEVVAALGNNDRGNPSWGRSAVLARASTVRWGFEWAAMGGKLAERWVAAGSSQGDVGPVTLRAEAHLGVPDKDGDGRDEADKQDDLHVRLASGPSVNVGWRNMVIGAEYSFISDGAKAPRDYLPRLTRAFPDDQPQLARHYVSASANAEIVPIVNAAVFTLVNANDGSGLTGLSLIYSVADEADIIAGVFTPWGDDPQVTTDPTNPLRLGSEYGAGPLTVYLEARAFF